jgi:hypothetical protein
MADSMHTAWFPHHNSVVYFENLHEISDLIWRNIHGLIMQTVHSPKNQWTANRKLEREDHRRIINSWRLKLKANASKQIFHASHCSVSGSSNRKNSHRQLPSAWFDVQRLKIVPLKYVYHYVNYHETTFFLSDNVKYVGLIRTVFIYPIKSTVNRTKI